MVNSSIPAAIEGGNLTSLTQRQHPNQASVQLREMTTGTSALTNGWRLRAIEGGRRECR